MKKQEEERNKRLVAQPSSLLILELINSFDFYYSVVYLLVIFFLFVFKRILFEYEFWLFIIEIIVSGVMILINFLRLKLISIGNKTEKSLMLLSGIILSIITIICSLYFTFLQTYVTYYDFAFGLIETILIFLDPETAES